MKVLIIAYGFGRRSNIHLSRCNVLAKSLGFDFLGAYSDDNVNYNYIGIFNFKVCVANATFLEFAWIEGLKTKDVELFDFYNYIIYMNDTFVNKHCWLLYSRSLKPLLSELNSLSFNHAKMIGRVDNLGSFKYISTFFFVVNTRAMILALSLVNEIKNETFYLIERDVTQQISQINPYKYGVQNNTLTSIWRRKIYDLCFEKRLSSIVSTDGELTPLFGFFLHFFSIASSVIKNITFKLMRK
jgi:hypothetical protein